LRVHPDGGGDRCTVFGLSTKTVRVIEATKGESGNRFTRVWGANIFGLEVTVKTDGQRAGTEIS